MACEWEKQKRSHGRLASEFMVLETITSCLSMMEPLHQGLECSTKGFDVIQSQIYILTLSLPVKANVGNYPISETFK